MAAYEGETYACTASSDSLKITQYRRCHSVHARSRRHKSAIADRAFHPHTSPDRSSVSAALWLVAAPELSGLVSMAARHYSLSRRLIPLRQLPFKLCHLSQR